MVDDGLPTYCDLFVKHFLSWESLLNYLAWKWTGAVAFRVLCARAFYGRLCVGKTKLTLYTRQLPPDPLTNHLCRTGSVDGAGKVWLTQLVSRTGTVLRALLSTCDGWIGGLKNPGRTLILFQILYFIVEYIHVYKYISRTESTELECVEVLSL